MLSPNLEETLQQALLFAAERGHEFATLEHLLLAIMDDADVVPLFKKYCRRAPEMEKELVAFIDKDLKCLIQQSSVREPRPTIAFQRVVQRAAIQVQSSGRDVVTAVHLIAAMFSEEESFAVYLLGKYGISRLDVVTFLSRSFPVTGVDDDEYAQSGEELTDFCINLNEKAKAGKTDTLIGRADEINRIIQVLCRRTKNNPLLIGDPGVGKTMLAEGLASKIVEGKVPAQLKNAVVYQLDLGALLAGTRYRGDFEERLKNILTALEDDPDALLFIDEIHTVIGAGATSGGTLDASNLLKPALASGSLRCIGSTTYKEFRAHMEKDRAFLRRFQKIDIKEPGIAETIEILRGIKGLYEKHHKVVYTAEAIKTAVDLSVRYLHDRKLPDKAIDVLDEAGAARALQPGRKKKQISARDIERIVSKMTNLPAKTMSVDDTEALRFLERDLKLTVFGQNKAIETLASSIKMARAGLREPEKPIGSYLFSGPTGVGKTEVARRLAKTLGVELLRFDMSEYMEKHSISRLIGAPPGYVGFDQGGLLTDAVDQHPYAVLLLDEIEKAHPDLFNVLLQVMDYGKLTDSNGKKIDFSNVVLIMTTNAGAADMSKPAVGFVREEREGEDKEAIERLFTPEFRNRLDAIIPFERLNQEIMGRVADKFISQLETLLAEKKIELAVNFSAREWLIKKGFDPKNGARPLARIIQEYVKKPLAEEILFGNLTHGGTASLTAKNEKLHLVCRPLPAPKGKKQEQELMLI
ncbi:MAG: ATP-dependent Clp protease ATP-binding subunit ClpA [Alphaproteobacteria bacterium]